MEETQKKRLIENRAKKRFFNNIWKSFYHIATKYEKAHDDRMASMFFEICDNIINKKDYFFTQNAIENTLALFSKNLDHSNVQDLKMHLKSIQEITGVPSYT